MFRGRVHFVGFGWETTPLYPCETRLKEYLARYVRDAQAEGEQVTAAQLRRDPSPDPWADADLTAYGVTLDQGFVDQVGN